jgi:hypothetical protein
MYLRTCGSFKAHSHISLSQGSNEPTPSIDRTETFLNAGAGMQLQHTLSSILF